MTPVTEPNANVKIDLEGLQMLFVDEKNEECIVGVLRDAPEGHPFRISIFERDAAGAASPIATLTGSDIKNELTIKVTNTSTTGISRRKMDMTIDRKAGPSTQVDDHDSFQWVVDFEKLIGKPISAKKSGFLSLLTVNHGELLARNLSKNQLRIRKGPIGDFELFGTVATRTGIDVILDQPNSQAVFKNGDDTIFTADNTSNFEILIERVCGRQPGGNDADAFFSAIEGLDEKDKVFFSSTPLDDDDEGIVPNTPDASCLQGTGGGPPGS